MGIGDWGLGIGAWAQSPIPNPQSPIPNPQSPSPNLFSGLNNINDNENSRLLLNSVYNNSENLFQTDTNTVDNTIRFNQNNNYQMGGFSNIFGSNNYNYREEREEYVYISATGKKYHGRPQCGRMKSSTKVTVSKARNLGLEPCMKCY